jgi:hypothetical protein
MHEYRVLDVTGESAAILESRLNELVAGGWMLDRMTHDSDGKPRMLFLLRVRPDLPRRSPEPRPS